MYSYIYMYNTYIYIHMWMPTLVRKVYQQQLVWAFGSAVLSPAWHGERGFSPALVPLRLRESQGVVLLLS